MGKMFGVCRIEHVVEKAFDGLWEMTLNYENGIRTGTGTYF